MDNQTEQQIEDIGEATRACRSVHPHGPWRIQIGDEHLDFHSAVFEDPVPTGLQLLELAVGRPPKEHLVYQLLRGGALEELRPTETTDLRSGGVERFLVFKGSSSYRIELDGGVIEWGKPVISGIVLKKLPGVAPATYGVWLVVRGSDDKPKRRTPSSSTPQYRFADDKMHTVSVAVRGVTVQFEKIGNLHKSQFQDAKTSDESY